MIYKNDCWHYKGQTYATLRDALLAAWGGRREQA